ncbi:MAG TPA: hypothetical protein VFR71_06820, partial [Methyloceanibacter sp.]|nr:hypothetical protein [Methyloceanibacter sp.]
ATLATARFSTEGATIAASLAQGSTVASKGPAAEAKIEGEGDQPALDGTDAVPSDGAPADAEQTEVPAEEPPD